ncbi:3-isopropylmalate dehydratase small subunit [Alphaproteobacteria bacterium]|jgi:3-isopropylmalate/(R)-2-methylmalate dehydratase small subunit|nr:3-isopropylmalate dehydratase small subunit [Alphaproteobacteria bacterium]
MEKLEKHSGVAAPLNLVNIDTDMIIPKQFLKTIKRTGLSEGLFFEMRFDEHGKKKEDFVLHQPQYEDANVLVAGQNFGCGSSREHAPWALLDWGFRVVIASSFADIFYNNCFNNGILPLQLPQEQVDELMKDANQAGRLKIDVKAQTVTRPNGDSYKFDMDPALKHRLVNGLDNVGLTLENTDSISAFEEKNAEECPWLAA